MSCWLPHSPALSRTNANHEESSILPNHFGTGRESAWKAPATPLGSPYIVVPPGRSFVHARITGESLLGPSATYAHPKYRSNKISSPLFVANIHSLFVAFSHDIKPWTGCLVRGWLRVLSSAIREQRSNIRNYTRRATPLFEFGIQTDDHAALSPSRGKTTVLLPSSIILCRQPASRTAPYFPIDISVVRFFSNNVIVGKAHDGPQQPTCLEANECGIYAICVYRGSLGMPQTFGIEAQSSEPSLGSIAANYWTSEVLYRISKASIRLDHRALKDARLENNSSYVPPDKLFRNERRLRKGPIIFGTMCWSRILPEKRNRRYQ
jgi:hypothetical protein